MPAPTMASGTGTVVGTARTTLYSEDLVVDKVSIRFSSAGSTHDVTTSDDGTYSIQLDPGDYTMTATANGFCPFTRAPFRVEAGRTISISPLLVVCPLANVVVTDEKGNVTGETCQYVPPYQTATILLGGSAKPSSQIQIRYFRQDSTTHGVTFQGAGTHEGFIDAFATLDSLSISAATIYLNKTQTALLATGHVVIEKDGKRTVVDRATVDLTTGAISNVVVYGH